MTCTQHSHDRAIADDAQWSTWIRVALWSMGGRTYDVRNCPHCGTTRQRLVPGARDLQWIPTMTLDDARKLYAQVESEVVT